MAPIFKSLFLLGTLAATTLAAPLQTTTNQKRAASSCTKDAPCNGQVTFYDTATSSSAPSSCGFTNDGENESVLALPHGIMTDADCGKTVTVKYGGITKTGKAVDKCMGCDDTSIDLSRHFFTELAALLEGRLFGVEWYME